MKKFYAIIMIVVMMTLLLSACGKEEEKEERKAVETSNTQNSESEVKEEVVEENSGELSGKITFANNRQDISDTKIQALLDEFISLHPGVEIENQVLVDNDKELSVRMAAGELPDLGPLMTTMSPSSYQEFYLPIDDTVFSEENLYFYDMSTGADGKLYAPVSGIIYMGYMYNKDAFETAGINNIPTTQEEFLEACEKIKAAGITPVATAFKDIWPLQSFYDGTVVSAITGENFVSNVNKNDKLIEVGGLQDSMEFVKTLNEKGYTESDIISASWDAVERDFVSGQISMMYEGGWFVDVVTGKGLDSDRVGMFPFPSSKAIPIKPDFRFAISKTCENVDIAVALLEFLWEDGKYAEACGLSSPMMGEPELAQYKELLSSGLPTVELVYDDKTQDIINKAEINPGEVLQNYVLGNSEEAVISTNEKWLAAKDKLK